MATLKRDKTAKNFDQSRALVHAVKGAAGNLGALALQRTAAVLEQHYIAGEPTLIVAELKTFQLEMDKVLQSISILIENDSVKEKGPSVEFDQEKVGKMLKGLPELIRNDYGAALDKVVEIKSLAQRSIIGEKLDQLMVLLNDFDEERAILHIREIDEMLEE